MYTVINAALNASLGINNAACTTDSDLWCYPTLAAAVNSVVLALPDIAEGCDSFGLCPNAWVQQATAAFAHLQGMPCGGTHVVQVPNGSTYIFVPVPELGANAPMVW